MLEVAGTHFEKGVFELHLEEASGGKLSRLRDIDPIRGRLVALALLVVAGFSIYFELPAHLFMKLGVTSDVFMALRLQSIFVWGGLVGVAGAFYAIMIFWRRERLDLAFDRHQSQVRLRSAPSFGLAPKKELATPFTDVRSVEVFGPEREPRTPHGFAELNLAQVADEKFQKLRFRFLSDEQRKFFPLNLSKMLGITPKGDWVDPDDEPAKS